MADQKIVWNDVLEAGDSIETNSDEEVIRLAHRVAAKNRADSIEDRITNLENELALMKMNHLFAVSHVNEVNRKIAVLDKAVSSIFLALGLFEKPETKGGEA